MSFQRWTTVGFSVSAAEPLSQSGSSRSGRMLVISWMSRVMFGLCGLLPQVAWNARQHQAGVEILGFKLWMSPVLEITM